VGLVVAVLIFFGAPGISKYMMESPLSMYALRVLAPGLFIVSVMGVLRGYFQGMGTMVPTAISQVIEQIVNALVSIIGASVLFQIGVSRGEKKGEELLGPAFGAAGGTLGTVVGALIACLFLGFVLFTMKNTLKRQLRKEVKQRDEKMSRILKILILTIIPVIFSTAIYNINQLLDLTLFNKIMAAQGYLEKEYMALQGIYTGKYNTLINVPLAMANGLAASIIPSLTAAVTSGHRHLTHEKISQSIRFTMLLALPCFVGFVVLASPLMILLYGDSSRTPAMLLTLGAITVVFYCWSTVSNSILQGLNQLSAPAKNAGISLVLHLVALLVMLIMLRWGVYALVASNIVFSVSMCILNARDIYRTCGYVQEWEVTIVRPLVASVMMGIATYLTYRVLILVIPGRFLATACAVLVAMVVYAIAILKLGVLSEEEILGMPKGALILEICQKIHLI
jgi:stage V sporulation protein B